MRRMFISICASVISTLSLCAATEATTAIAQLEEVVVVSCGEAVGELIPDTYIPDSEALLAYAAMTDKPAFKFNEEESFAKWATGMLRYPLEASKAGVAGKAIASFQIDGNGCVKNVKIVQSASQSLDAEVMRVILKSPSWTPATDTDNTEAVTYLLPVVFQLR